MEFRIPKNSVATYSAPKVLVMSCSVSLHQPCQVSNSYALDAMQSNIINPSWKSSNAILTKSFPENVEGTLTFLFVFAFHLNRFLTLQLQHWKGYVMSNIQMLQRLAPYLPAGKYCSVQSASAQCH